VSLILQSLDSLMLQFSSFIRGNLFSPKSLCVCCFYRASNIKTIFCSFLVFTTRIPQKTLMKFAPQFQEYDKFDGYV